MKANMKNYLLMGRFFLLGVAGASLLTACSDDDDPDPVALTTPVKSGEAVATLNSLTINWQSVTGASNYSYVLKDASGTVVSSGTTTQTSINFSGLAAGSTYTLEVTANPSATDTASLASSTLTMTGTTQGYIQLAAPTVSAQTAARTVISWNAVQNADSYTYSYELNGEKVEETTAETTLVLDFLPLDTDVKISVIASNSINEQYTTSDAGSVVAKRTRTEVSHARAATTVWDNAANAYVTTDVKYRITAYSDGSYTVKDWYGFSGYDLTFMEVSQGSGSLKIDGTNYEDYPDYAWLDITGANTNDGVQVYTGSYSGYDYAGFSGDVATSGSFWIWDNTKYEQFCISWEEPTVTYQGTWTLGDSTITATVNGYSDGTYTIENWYGYEGYDFDFTLGEGDIIVPSSGYYYDDSYASYWVYTGPTASDGAWIVTYTGYSNWDATGIWFWDWKSNSYYYLVFAK
jgi:hypothetical protein